MKPNSFGAQTVIEALEEHLRAHGVEVPVDDEGGIESINDFFDEDE